MRPFFSLRILLFGGALALLAAGMLVFFVPRPLPVASAPAPVIATPKPAWPEHSVIGASVEGRSIDEYTYLPVGVEASSGLKHLVFVGGIHGGYEWNSVVVAYDLMDYLHANASVIPHNEAITVIPDANPDAVYKATGKEGRITATDIDLSADLSADRFNADGVDLNRNFDCHWKATAVWQNKTVSAGTAPFSEPEAQALRDYLLPAKPAAVVFWHSQANGVYASQCDGGILPQTLTIMNTYARASGYPAIKTFDAYPTTGASEDWLASQGIPAVTVELSSHKNVEWEKNLKGILALLEQFK